jgi:hypothetical protein
MVMTLRGEEVYFHAFSASVPDGDEWPASYPGRFIPEK